MTRRYLRFYLAHTPGLFQVDSDLFKSILVEMRPKSSEDIIALVALGRPAGMGMDKVYCERSHTYKNKLSA